MPAAPPVSPLKLFRVASGLTQVELGAVSKVSRDQISRLEAGLVTSPQARTRKALAEALGQPESLLFPNNRKRHDDDRR